MKAAAFSDIGRRVVAYGLPGQPEFLLEGLELDRAPDEPLADDRWKPLLQEVQRHRVPGLLMAAVDDGALAVTESQREDARHLHLNSCSSVLGLERRLLEVVEVLENALIEVVVLKGSAHAHLCYPDPAMRHFGDVDLLVPSHQLYDAVTVLREVRGTRRSVPELRPGFDGRFAKSVTLDDPTGVEIDLHRTLLFGTFAFAIDEDELFADTVTFSVGGRELRALSPETRLLHVSYHAGLGDKRPRGNSMRDLAQVWLTGDHDDARLLSLARGWRSEAVLSHGLELCRDVLDIEVGGSLAEGLRRRQPGPDEVRAIASYVGANNSHAAKVRASLPFLDRFRDRVAFVRASLAPSTGYVAQRSHGRLGWLRRGWRSFRRR